MTFRYSIKWIYFEFAVALAMALAVYVGLRPEWWGWLMFLPLFLFLVFDGARKASYSLTVDGDQITVGSFKSAQYLVSRITAVNVWEAKGGRITVVDLSDGSRFNFSSRVEGFDELIGLLKTKANLK